VVHHRGTAAPALQRPHRSLARRLRVTFPG
jgi:hypothetical protein